MSKPKSQWKWTEGEVDARQEHFHLRHGEAATTPYEAWVPVARIARAEGQQFTVQWLISAESPEHRAMRDAARRELEFYLIEKGEADPWAYAKHHCTTYASLYSLVHWSYFPGGQDGERVASFVVHAAGEGAEAPVRELPHQLPGDHYCR